MEHYTKDYYILGIRNYIIELVKAGFSMKEIKEAVDYKLKRYYEAKRKYEAQQRGN